MNKFIIRKNDFLNKDIQSYYSCSYLGYHTKGNPDFINYLNNQFGTADYLIINNAKNELVKILKKDLEEIKACNNTKLSVCVVPRSKADNYYSNNQKIFRETVSEVVRSIDNFEDCTKFIVRHIDTRTTHMNMSGYGGDGDMPYVGITKATCNIHKDVSGKDILLIDDIYTKGVNIDEDAIQALLDCEANSVIFYAIARTALRKKALLKSHLQETLSVLDNVSDLNTVANIRGLSRSTIVKHIQDIVSILGTDPIVHIKPSQSIICAVENAIKKRGRDRLKPIFEELGEKVSYDDIRISLMFIN